jgi:hypothetical protein
MSIAAFHLHIFNSVAMWLSMQQETKALCQLLLSIRLLSIDHLNGKRQETIMSAERNRFSIVRTISTCNNKMSFAFTTPWKLADW